jgi:hypothetical protein
VNYSVGIKHILSIMLQKVNERPRFSPASRKAGTQRRDTVIHPI